MNKIAFLTVLLTSCGFSTAPQNANLVAVKGSNKNGDNGIVGERNTKGSGRETIGDQEKPGSEGGTAGMVQELKELEQKRAQAIARADTAFLEQNTADDYTSINSRGMLRTKAQLLADFKSGQIKLQSNDIADLYVRIYGQAAVVTGRSAQKGRAYGQDTSGEYRFTRVYVKQNGRWQAVAFQATPITQHEWSRFGGFGLESSTDVTEEVNALQ